MDHKKLVPGIIFIIHVLAIIAYHIFGYLGHFGYDDLHYARLAIDFSNGIVDFNDHFTYRLPVIILTALSYSVFGVSDFASAIPPMFITFLTLVLVFLLLKNKNYLTQLFGQSLTVFSSWFIFYSDKLMPDIYVAFSVMLALFILHQYKFGNKKYTMLYSIGLALALLFGFMAKETIVLVAPLLLYFAIVDFIFRRDLKFWTYSILFGFVILASYFIMIWLLTGNVAKRFEAITSNSYLNLCSYDRQPVKFLLERISYGFVSMLTYQGMLVGYIFVFIYLIRNNVKNYYKFIDSFSYWLVSAVILFLSSNFMTISVNSYSPMCLDPRHFLFLVPVVAIPAATLLNQFAETKENAVLYILIFLLAAVSSFFLPGETLWFHYVPLGVLILLFRYSKNLKFSKTLFAITFIMVLAIMPFKSVLYARKVNYQKQKEIVIEQVLKKYNGAVVVTDEVQKRLGNYFLGFNEINENTFISFNDFKPDSATDKKTLLHLNWYTQYLSGINNDELPLFAKNIHTSNKLIFEDKDLKISIYELNQLSILSSVGKQLLLSQNNFENTPIYWNLNGNTLSETIKYEGEKSLLMNEFSATFSYPLDSLPTQDFSKIIIASKVFCNFSDQTTASLVFSIENESGSYIWHGQQMNKYIKAYSNWWPVSFDISVNSNEIKPNSNLKIYVWNIDKQKAFIDNFKVEITGLKE